MCRLLCHFAICSQLFTIVSLAHQLIRNNLNTEIVLNKNKTEPNECVHSNACLYIFNSYVHLFLSGKMLNTCVFIFRRRSCIHSQPIREQHIDKLSYNTDKLDFCEHSMKYNTVMCALRQVCGEWATVTICEKDAKKKKRNKTFK